MTCHMKQIVGLIAGLLSSALYPMFRVKMNVWVSLGLSGYIRHRTNHLCVFFSLDLSSREIICKPNFSQLLFQFIDRILCISIFKISGPPANFHTLFIFNISGLHGLPVPCLATRAISSCLGYRMLVLLMDLCYVIEFQH